MMLFGIVKESKDSNVVNFALDIDRTDWIKVPAALIAKSEELGSVDVAGVAYKRARLELVSPQTPEGQLLALVASKIEQSLFGLARKVGPALDTSTDADPACLRCLEQCKLIVVTKSDPFAQITCMLNCTACP